MYNRIYLSIGTFLGIQLRELANLLGNGSGITHFSIYSNRKEARNKSIRFQKYTCIEEEQVSQYKLLKFSLNPFLSRSASLIKSGNSLYVIVVMMIHY